VESKPKKDIIRFDELRGGHVDREKELTTYFELERDVALKGGHFQFSRLDAALVPGRCFAD
jgi:hypothetical protein